MDMKKPKPMWLAQTEIGVAQAHHMRRRVASEVTSRLVEAPPTQPVPLPSNVLKLELRQDPPDIVA